MGSMDAGFCTHLPAHPQAGDIKLNKLILKFIWQVK